MIHLLSFFISVVGLFLTHESAKPAPQPVVVLELFTSQGCSSCPPADKLLQEITQRATQSGQAIYGLSFHVDYWNRLGWSDPFSAKSYTDRQRQYDRLLKSQTYTPQLIINGQQEVIGGQRGRIQQAIQTIQQQPASSFVTVEASLKKQGSQVTVSYGLSDTGPYRINVALVQKEAHTAVKNGENGGRTLVNTNVVRQFKTVDNPAKSGTATLPIPNDLSTDQAAVLVYVQRTDNQQIVGAKLLQ
ncbi:MULTISPECIES: thioredoxin family protein [unclassified Spirosoma]|uniref:DUF1223 domain-containing protein n=1 Tax=unclassified Spirosoma TaxID=2621999 RepID=UPI0009678AFE|nr:MULTISPECIES: DUF1223 domain-containing protein [unclassified Spirosoma]MBN8821942.1 DUF1223 domain-containing protein [Spirosoma sp.]OJW80583.1 MAG: hypothetical protein BGO59_34480 [Spirosoma sp. 48-14]